MIERIWYTYILKNIYLHLFIHSNNLRYTVPLYKFCSGSAVGNKKPAVVLRYSVPLLAQDLLLATRSLLLCCAILSLYLLRSAVGNEKPAVVLRYTVPLYKFCSGSAVGNEKPAVVLRYTVPLYSFAQDLLLTTRSLLLCCAILSLYLLRICCWR